MASGRHHLPEPYKCTASNVDSRWRSMTLSTSDSWFEISMVTATLMMSNTRIKPRREAASVDELVSAHLRRQPLATDSTA